MNLAEMFLAVEICVLSNFWKNKYFMFLDVLSTLLPGKVNCNSEYAIREVLWEDMLPSNL